jgi:phage terminase small subunit
MTEIQTIPDSDNVADLQIVDTIPAPAIVLEQSISSDSVASDTNSQSTVSNDPEKDSPYRPLTRLESDFVEHYLGNLNATQACKNAGYRCRNDLGYRAKGAKLVKLPHIKRVIDIRRAELQISLRAKTEINRAYILERLRTLAEMTMRVEAVRQEGKTIVLYQPQASARCWELLGKEVEGMFVDRTADVSDSLKEREAERAIIKKAHAIVNKAETDEKSAQYARVKAIP